VFYLQALIRPLTTTTTAAKDVQARLENKIQKTEESTKCFKSTVS